MQLPVSVFESAVDHNSGQTVLSSVTVKIVSETAEQIGTDHAAKSTTAGDKNETTAAKKLDELSGALKMLWKGLKLGQAYMLVNTPVAYIVEYIICFILRLLKQNHCLLIQK